MTTFRALEGDTIILRQSGTFYQRDLFEFNGGLFAKHGSGFIRVYQDGATSKPKVTWETMSRPLCGFDRFGKALA